MSSHVPARSFAENGCCFPLHNAYLGLETSQVGGIEPGDDSHLASPWAPSNLERGWIDGAGPKMNYRNELEITGVHHTFEGWQL